RLQPVQREWSHANAREIADVVTELREHPPHLAVASFADGDLQDALVAQPLDDLDSAPAGAKAFAGLRVRQPYAALHLLDDARRNEAVDHGAICLGDAVTRVRELIGELAVVGEQK